MIEEITLRLGIDDGSHKGYWTMEFNNNGKEYFIKPSDIFPVKKRENIRYLLEKGILSEYDCLAEYDKYAKWTKSGRALYIKKDVKATHLEAFIMLEGDKLTPPNVGKKERKEMKIDKSDYESRFLKAADLEESVVNAVIDRMELVEVIREGETDTAKGLFFEEYEKPMALNKTNLKTLVEAFGDETREWKGKKVFLSIVKANNPTTKQQVDSIAVGIPKKQ